MNLFSVRSAYALRALCEIALWQEAGHEEPLAVEQISKRQAVPRKFLEQILVSLKRADIVRSQRGQSGGYRLARDPEKIRFFDVLAALESSPGTGSGRQESPPTAAAHQVRAAFERTEAVLRDSLEKQTLAALLESLRRQDGRAMYHI